MSIARQPSFLPPIIKQAKLPILELRGVNTRTDVRLMKTLSSSMMAAAASSSPQLVNATTLQVPLRIQREFSNMCSTTAIIQ
ncbi:hypothetical protein FOZ62_023597 [Perkinsus olseni]|uniref:Uncharacterized protein n=1 Tax=Perkinsus olseni TaxID=32597 RepID=A0A7J6Q7H7_PEROL|nr:hypothetical protein FOZ62_023597 [Perkinsus olseni]